MTYETILIERVEKVGLITLNRPNAMNALNGVLMTELINALSAFDADEQIGAIVIAGNERVFAAGADISEMAKMSSVEMVKGSFVELFDGIRNIKKPIIAAVSGFALGGGCELAMSCDMIIASEKAKFGQPEINLGVIPGAGGTQRLTRAVGKVIAMEMVLNNRILSAKDALDFGLVNRVAPVDEYLKVALKLAKRVAARAPLALRQGKAAVNKAFELSLTEGLEFERRAFYFLFATEDQKEGMAAFTEKRSAEWKGE
ncbi:MAG: enoyl-CoA hydratase [Anaerolineae bacterium]|jgi:enoyl-CoA hydratase|nr:enoyl-CoA hydratase [Anaerolineae bacterium]MBT3714016.1 enoyl-CoA hydratase [Anaerolineae bacterium]MBT4312191.1 enoyl-CoA hydratase [Anaerolineae bacterium]MBT4459906.1 enoyl-CoA hydratase [Anaerolineae bacterium]MBT4841438.1 enoyl-CoA hydratase [Anaerolineae bacterium]